VFAKNPRGRWLKVVLITLAAGWIASSSAIATIRFFDKRRVESEARQCFAQAQEAAKPVWTEDDAVLWLRNHDFNAYRGEGADPGGRRYLVEGGRPISKGGMIAEPASVHIRFLFGLDHRFDHVEYDVWPFRNWPK
jgi:hypothetical protein